MAVPLRAGFRGAGDPDPDVAILAARAWLAGGIVGLPTETVYGLAADAQDAEAVARIYRVKGRPADHPLIVHVTGPEALAGWSAHENEQALSLARAFWPGPLTVIVARGPRAGDFITGGQATVALRCPDHPVARACLEALVRASGDPARGVAAPSANRFGRVSPTRAVDVVTEVGRRMDPGRDLIIDGGPCAVGVESTIVDCTARPPRVLRPGAISQAQIDAVLAGPSPGREGAAPPLHAPVARGEPGSVAPAAGAAGRRTGRAGSEVDDVRAPGTLDSHYAPAATVVLLEPDEVASDPQCLVRTGDALLAGTAHPLADSPSRPASVGDSQVRVGLIAQGHVDTPVELVRIAAPGTVEEYARGLYAALRKADELGLAFVIVVPPANSAGPLALAVRDRVARAAHPG